MAGETMTAADYIKHHLQSLTSLSDVAQGQGLKNIADFSFINLDAIFFAVLLGVLGSFLLWRGAKKAKKVSILGKKLSLGSSSKKKSIWKLLVKSVLGVISMTVSV